MNCKGLVLITDSSPGLNSSTSRELLDLVTELEKNSIPIFLIHPSFNYFDKYSKKSKSITCRPIFYKSESHVLRLISEIHIATVFSLKIFLFQKCLKNKNILYISPSALCVFPALLIKKLNNGSIYLMLRDLFPFWMIDAGILSPKGIAVLILKKIADLQMATADRIGVESKKSKTIFLKRYPQYQKKTEVLNNWMTSKSVSKYSPKKKKVKFVYAGNVGKAQGIELFKALLNHLKDNEQVEVHLFGRGCLVNEMKNFSANYSIFNFHLHSIVLSKEFDDYLREFDIGLFFLRTDLKASNIPGKFISYVMNGLPVLGSVNSDNELVSLVKENNLGYIDSSGETAKFLNMADKIISEVSSGNFSPCDIQMRASQFFDTQKAAEQLTNLEW